MEEDDDDLRKTLMKSMKKTGMIESLKSQLRLGLVNELIKQNVVKKPEQKYFSESFSIFQQAANSLVADHLRQCQYDYTLSVFIPESATAPDKILSLQDLLHLLKIGKNSKLYKSLMSQRTEDDGMKGFLWRLLSELAACCSGNSDSRSIQTDPNIQASTIEEKLERIDEIFLTNIEKDQLKSALSSENKLISYQRHLEERMRTDLRREKDSFKENELARVRMEEKNECRREIDRMRKEFQETYRHKYESFTDKQRLADDNIRKQQDTFERETYAQRQTVLEELSTLRDRESTMKNNIEHQKRSLSLEEERLKTIETNLRLRESAVSRIEETYEKKLLLEMNIYKDQVTSDYKDRVESVKLQENKNKQETERLCKDAAVYDKLRDELREKQNTILEQGLKMDRAKVEVERVTKENSLLTERARSISEHRHLNDENSHLKSEIDNLKSRLDIFSAHHRPGADERSSGKPEHIKELQHYINQQSDEIRQMNQEITDLKLNSLQTISAMQHEKFPRPRVQLGKQLSLDGYPGDIPMEVESPCFDDDSPDESDPHYLPRGADPDMLLAGYQPPSRAPAYDSSSPDSSIALIAESKLRVEKLQREAEHMDEYYRNHKDRLVAMLADFSPEIRQQPWAEVLTPKDKLKQKQPIQPSRIDRGTDPRTDRHPDRQTDRHTDPHTDRETDPHTDRHTDPYTDRETGPHTDPHTDRQADTHVQRQLDRHTDRHTDGHPDRHTDRHTDPHTDRQADTHVHRQLDRPTDTHTDKHIDRHTDRHTDSPDIQKSYFTSEAHGPNQHQKPDPTINLTPIKVDPSGGSPSPRGETSLPPITHTVRPTSAGVRDTVSGRLSPIHSSNDDNNTSSKQPTHQTKSPDQSSMSDSTPRSALSQSVLIDSTWMDKPGVVAAATPTAHKPSHFDHISLDDTWTRGSSQRPPTDPHHETLAGQRQAEEDRSNQQAAQMREELWRPPGRSHDDEGQRGGATPSEEHSYTDPVDSNGSSASHSQSDPHRANPPVPDHGSDHSVPIDPMMQKYMEMVKQNRQPQENVTVQSDGSIEEHIDSVGSLSNDDGNEW